MKIKELAAELNLSGDAVLEKAKAMGIDVSSTSDEMADIDATAVKNTILRSGTHTETKVVRAKAKKSENEKKEDGPKVTVKAANIKLPEVKKSSKTAAKAAAKPAAKPPAGKPVISKEIEGRPKPPEGKPVVSKTMLEERIAKESAEKEAAAKPENVQSIVGAQQEDKVIEKAQEEAAAPERKEEVRMEDSRKKEQQKTEPPKRRSGLKVIKRAEDVRREEAEAAERRARRNEERKAAEKENKDSRDDRKRTSDRRGSDKRTSDRKQSDRKSSERRNDRNDRGDRNERGSKPAARRDDSISEVVASKPASHRSEKKNKDKDKEHDKFAKLERGGKKGSKTQPKSLEKQVRNKKHNKQKPAAEPEVETVELPSGTVLINVPITVAGFAEQTKTTVSKIIMTLMKMGVMANVNQNLDEDTVVLLAEEMGIQVAIGKVQEEIEEEGIEQFEDKEEDLKPRAPIITVMGHVDHGKTSLLDAIRKTNVTASESGGITQHIGASEVEINGQKIVFLDTPGHEAFTAMRARGAHSTDIAVLVVAADDSVKPQTIESISHAKAAGVPIIVAINKMDKPGANPEVVKADLANNGVLVEDWGGDVISVPVSAKTGEGIVNLLEMILLQAEVLELKANPDRLALGTVLEARLDKAKGPVASLLVLNGTLKAGMSVVAGTCSGKIRLMTNHKGEKLRLAGPATAVEILGLTDVPHAGDVFNAVKDDRLAREIAEKRAEKQREEVLARNSSTTLEELFSQIQEGEVKELNLIIKGDVQGSVGAIVSSLEKLSNDEVRVKIVHTGVGTVNESDIMLAGTSGSIIIGFNVRPSAAVSAIAEREGIQIRTYRVIYDIIDDVENAMKGMLDPEFKEVVLGTVEIRNTFKVPGVGIVGGAYVTDGKVVRNEQIRLVRDGIVIHEGKIASLKRFKDDAKEVAQGYECGIGIENYNDIKEGDVIECFTMEEIERK
ncbi:MAG: translation initiation factor IF-2 [Bacillota bacterium]|nr:translation initiation factor IF-2 [Bacillota bacterium]